MFQKRFDSPKEKPDLSFRIINFVSKSSNKLSNDQKLQNQTTRLQSDTGRLFSGTSIRIREFALSIV